jgi:hypothetical protein
MKNLFKALSDFQNEVPVILKDTSGYGYKFADLPAIFKVINPLLKKNGIGFTQLGEGKSIKTIVFHIESGETLESIFDIPQGVQLAKMNEFQVLGSAITYMRRYALSSALGIITDSDIDAAGEQIKVDHSKILSDISKINNESKLYEYHKQELKSTSNAAILELLNKRKLEINGK